MNSSRMRTLVFCFSPLVVTACAGAPSTNTNRAGPADRAAIETAYQNWYAAWKTKDHMLAAKDYSDDAIWVNAFGMRRVGRKAIEQSLKDVFAMDFVMAGRSETVEKTVRFIPPNVALVTSAVEREGQKTSSGDDLPTRRTSHLRVFAKTAGSWKIVSHLISDARSKERPGHEE